MVTIISLDPLFHSDLKDSITTMKKTLALDQLLVEGAPQLKIKGFKCNVLVHPSKWLVYPITKILIFNELMPTDNPPKKRQKLPKKKIQINKAFGG